MSKSKESKESIIAQESQTKTSNGLLSLDTLVQHKNILLILFAVLLAIPSGYIFYANQSKQQLKEAQAALYQAEFLFEVEQWEKALNGDGNYLGFIQIMDEYGKKSIPTLPFYAGVCYLKLQKYQEAIDMLSSISLDDLLLQARVFVLLGDSYTQLNDYGTAATYYQKACSYKANKQFTPLYLMKLAMAYEKLEDVENAKKAYTKILDVYTDFSEIEQVKRYLGAL